MNIDRLVVGQLKCNCYILSIDNTCIVIDPGDEIDKIKESIGNKKVLAVLITHHHFDHIGCINYFKKELLLDKNNLQEKNYKIGKFNFEVIYTPGHKEDLITIYFKEYNIMFTGDFLFKDGIGRTDLKGGNIESMINSLKKMTKYNKDIIIYPGHGESSTLEEIYKYI